jgi:hypothetical protein
MKQINLEDYFTESGMEEFVKLIQTGFDKNNNDMIVLTENGEIVGGLLPHPIPEKYAHLFDERSES